MSTCKAALAAFAAAACIHPAFAQAADGASAPFAVAPWSVFVDLPTRFAFIKTPSGWKFIEQLSPEQVAALAPTVLTSLLPPEEVADRYPTSLSPNAVVASDTSFGEGRKSYSASPQRFRRARNGGPTLMLPPQN